MNTFNLGIQHRIFNNEVRKRRVEMGLTQKQLGEKLGGWNRINGIENFKVYPSKKEAEKIAEVLGATVAVLFPEWLEIFKPTKTMTITEHFITDPLLNNINNPLLISDGQEQFEDMFDKQLIKDYIAGSLNDLNDRERRILEERFGLTDSNPKSCAEISKDEMEKLGIDRHSTGVKTYEEVAHIFGVTRERIRQLEQHALRRLRHNPKIRKIMRT